jgi:hypothetical protein
MNHAVIADKDATTTQTQPTIFNPKMGGRETKQKTVKTADTLFTVEGITKKPLLLE